MNRQSTVVEWGPLLTNGLRCSEIQPNTSYRHAHAILAERMDSYADQDPQIEGVDREVLGFQATSKSDVVASYDGDRVVFKAGTLANFVVGSTVAVFPGMPKTPDWNSAPVVVKIGVITSISRGVWLKRG